MNTKLANGNLNSVHVNTIQFYFNTHQLNFSITECMDTAITEVRINDGIQLQYTTILYLHTVVTNIDLEFVSPQ